MRIMQKFVEDYLGDYKEKKLRILEIGSFCGSAPEKDLVFRRFFRNPNWEFIGMDIVSGPNVDVVSEEMYHYPFADNSFDVVISGSTFEHVKDIYKVTKEMERITSNLVCIAVPNTAPYHCHPVDCWRIFPDGLNFLLTEIARMEVLRCKMAGNNKNFTVGIAKKICVTI